MARRYGLLHLVFDVAMSYITNGWWLVWVIVREIQYNRKS